SVSRGEWRFLVEEGGRRPPRPKLRMGNEPAEEGEIRLHAADLSLAQRGGERIERFLPRLLVSDQLRDQRVVGDQDRVAFLDALVDADGLGQPQARDRSGAGEEG